MKFDQNNLTYTADPYGYVRHLTRSVQIGSVVVGDENSIRVQATATTELSDTLATVAQIKELVNLGCEIVRLPITSLEIAQNLQNIRGQMQAQSIDLPLVACLPFENELVFEAARWVNCLSVALPISQSSAQIEKDLGDLISTCQEYNLSLEVAIDLVVPENMTEHIETVLDFANLFRQSNFHPILFSVNAPDPITTTKAYRFLVAGLRQLEWNYPIHLVGSISAEGEPGFVGAITALGTLLEDGIGDAVEIPLNDDPRRVLNLAWRVVRRYTEIHWSVLEKAGVNVPIKNRTDKSISIVSSHDEMPIVLASRRANHKQAAKDLARRYAKQSKKVRFYGKPLDEFPFVIADVPDHRNPYFYTRRRSSVVQIGSVKIGGNNPLPLIGRLGENDTPNILAARFSNLVQIVDGNWLNQFLTEEKLQDTLQQRLDTSNNNVVQPDLFILDYIDAKIYDLKTSGLVKQPFIVTVQDADEAQAALAYDIDALTVCVDLVGQIGIGLSDLEPILRVVSVSPIPLLLVSTHNAGQRWLSYDYWPEFFEAYQLIEAIELCYKYNVFDLAVGIYTYNTAWNIQNNRLLAALLQERGWTPPIHLIAPDVNSPIYEERLVDAAISLGSLLTDGFGDSIQTDYLPKDNFDGFNPLTMAQKVKIAHDIRDALKLAP